MKVRTRMPLPRKLQSYHWSIQPSKIMQHKKIKEQWNTLQRSMWNCCKRFYRWRIDPIRKWKSGLQNEIVVLMLLISRIFSKWANVYWTYILPKSNSRLTTQISRKYHNNFLCCCCWCSLPLLLQPPPPLVAVATGPPPPHNAVVAQAACCCQLLPKTLLQIGLPQLPSPSSMLALMP